MSLYLFLKFLVLLLTLFEPPIVSAVLFQQQQLQQQYYKNSLISSFFSLFPWLFHNPVVISPNNNNRHIPKCKRNHITPLLNAQISRLQKKLSRSSAACVAGSEGSGGGGTVIDSNRRQTTRLIIAAAAATAASSSFLGYTAAAAVKHNSSSTATSTVSTATPGLVNTASVLSLSLSAQLRSLRLRLPKLLRVSWRESRAGAASPTPTPMTVTVTQMAMVAAELRKELSQLKQVLDLNCSTTHADNRSAAAAAAALHSYSSGSGRLDSLEASVRSCHTLVQEHATHFTAELQLINATQTTKALVISANTQQQQLATVLRERVDECVLRLQYVENEMSHFSNFVLGDLQKKVFVETSKLRESMDRMREEEIPALMKRQHDDVMARLKAFDSSIRGLMRAKQSVSLSPKQK